MSQIVGVTVHYTVGAYSQTPAQVAAYQVGAAAAGQTGADPRQPFPAIAYTLGVLGDGTVCQFHDLATRVWHSAASIAGVARNANYASIVWFGDGSPRPCQIDGLARGIVWLERELGHVLLVEGHGDQYLTDCPGPGWPAEWRAVLLGTVASLR